MIIALAAAILMAGTAATPYNNTINTVPIKQAPDTIIAEVTDETKAADGSDIVEVVVDPVYRMTVPVSIDGQGPYNFLIDTGSERTVVSNTLAGQLQLELVEQALLQSVAGHKIVDTAFVPDLALGKQNYGGLIAPLLESVDIGADGILGLDGLQDQRILFDFRVNQIAIEDTERSTNQGYDIVVVGRARSGQLILTNATVSGIPVTVVIDTGAQTSIGNRALQRKLRTRRARGTNDQSELTAVTGQTIMADVGIVPDFRVGRAQFSQIGIAFADSPTFKTLNLHRRPALFLGMNALRKFDRVAIDFKRRRVLFDLPNTARPAVPSRIKRYRG